MTTAKRTVTVERAIEFEPYDVSCSITYQNGRAVIAFSGVRCELADLLGPLELDDLDALLRRLRTECLERAGYEVRPSEEEYAHHMARKERLALREQERLAAEKAREDEIREQVKDEILAKYRLVPFEVGEGKSEGN